MVTTDPGPTWPVQYSGVDVAMLHVKRVCGGGEEMSGVVITSIIAHLSVVQLAEVEELQRTWLVLQRE